jgi:hypothetical protein
VTATVGRQSGSASRVLSYDAAAVGSAAPSNAAGSGSLMVLFGLCFGSFSFSNMIQLRITRRSSTFFLNWQSDSCLGEAFFY